MLDYCTRESILIKLLDELTMTHQTALNNCLIYVLRYSAQIFTWLISVSHALQTNLAHCTVNNDDNNHRGY